MIIFPKAAPLIRFCTNAAGADTGRGGGGVFLVLLVGLVAIQLFIITFFPREGVGDLGDGGDHGGRGGSGGGSGERWGCGCGGVVVIIISIIIILIIIL